MTPTILIVEDEHHFAYALKVALGTRGYVTMTAADGAEALRVLERGEHEFSLVLLDLMLPKVSGEEVLDYLSISRPETPIIVISGHVDMDRYIELMARGCRDILFKPIDINVLLGRVTEIVREPRPPRAKAANG